MTVAFLGEVQLVYIFLKYLLKHQMGWLLISEEYY